MTWLVLLAVVVLLALGARLFVVVGVATMLSFILVLGEGMSAEGLVRIVNKIENLTTKNVFLSIPFFVAAGTVMTRGGMAARLVRVARALVGWLPGGLAIAAVVACIVFAAISGSSPVTLVAVGSIMFPALVQHGYPERASMGLLTTAGSLGCLVPPSVAMIIYSISVSGAASVTPSDLFVGGLVPALGITLLLALYAFFVGKDVPDSRVAFSLAELRDALREGAFACVLPAIVLGGIYSGQFTPTEAGAVALMYAVVVTTLVHRDMDLRGLYGAFCETAVLVGSLVLIVVLAFGLNDFLAEIEAADRMGAWLQSAELSPVMFLLVVNAALIFIGALMDSVSATLVFAPLLAPIALRVYGIDPVHFGVVFVVNMEIGYLAPPVATNLFVGAAIFKRPFGEVARAVMPTLAIVIAALVVIMYVPTLSKGLLNYKAGVAVYEPFPWDGARVVQAPTDGPVDAGVVDTVAPSVDAGPHKALTIEELMQKAQQQQQEQQDAGAAASTSPPPAPGRALTIEELMKKAQEQQQQQEQQQHDAGAP